MPRIQVPSSGGAAATQGTVKWTSGNYYAPTGTPATGVIAAGQLEGCLLAVEPGKAIDRMVFELTAVAASSTTRPLLYADAGGYPGALLLNSGTAVDTSAGGTGVGLQSVTVSYTVPSDALYVWAVVLVLGGGPTLRRVTSFNPQTAFPGTAAGLAVGGGGYFVTGQASVPDPFPAGATPFASMTRVGVRAA